MASLNGVQTRAILAKGVVGQVSDDQSVAIRLKALGAAGAVTSVTVTTGTNIVMVTAGGGTDTYAFATYTTVGALVDAINGDGIFEARVLDTLRSKATATQFIDGAITISSAGYYDVLVDSSAADYMAYCLSSDRFAGMNYKLRDGHRVSLQEIVYNITFGGGADAGGIKVYERTPASRGNVEQELLSILPVDATKTTINWANGNGKITSADGNEIVVVIGDATSVTGFLSVAGIVE